MTTFEQELSMRRKHRDESVIRRAKEMHEECMKDPEYAAKWREVTAGLFGLLADLPEDALDDQS